MADLNAHSIKMDVEYVDCGELGVLVILSYAGTVKIMLWTPLDIYMMATED